MSRKMIDYQVENGKIKSIDGYNVGVDEEDILSTFTPIDDKVTNL